MAKPLDKHRTLAISALLGLVMLKLIMLSALFTQTMPHPPAFIAPTLAASMALSALCIGLILTGSRWLPTVAGIIALESLLSFGPHKLYPGESPAFFAQTPAVYPVIIVGTTLILVLIVNVFKMNRLINSSQPLEASASRS
ncbi:hypothetical protein [Hahella ganghwensis]|uniref:hypothetical protein n=1 Tax=Hahella ganghwensis TaxID=286420 RepID=UPI0003747869|nr:hypothetical protein [Hahella ganghwensis]